MGNSLRRAFSTFWLFSAISGGGLPANAETVSDYAIVKSAQCYNNCTRAAQIAPAPLRGVTINWDGGVIARTSTTKIVDFESKTASLLIYERAVDTNGKTTFNLTKRSDATFDDTELSFAINIANRIWNPLLPPRRQAGAPLPPPPPPCFDSFYTLTLFDGPAALPRLDTCAFRYDPNGANERAFASWLDSVLRNAQAAPVIMANPGTVITSFPVSSTGWAANNSRFLQVSGTIESSSPVSVTAKPDTGGTVQTLKIDGSTLYLKIEAITFADIKEGDVVASTAVRKDDGKFHATSVRILRDKTYGTGGSLISSPERVTAEGPISHVANVNGANILLVDIRKTEIVVDPDTPITVLLPADTTIMQPGARVSIDGETTNEGSFADRVTLQ